MNDTNEPRLGPWLKGFPHAQTAVPADAVGALGWRVLDGDLPFPVAVLKRGALEHNIAWMQAFVRERGIELAPHGKTTLSPQLFRRQIAAGAWGLTLANVGQLRLGVSAGARRLLIANQVLADADLSAIAALLSTHADLRVVFLVDSLAQLQLIESWWRAHADLRPFEVLLEVGVVGGRTGCRGHEEALELARAMRASPAVRLVGLECYEGLGAKAHSAEDSAYADALMERVDALAHALDAEGLLASEEVLMSAGGSALFDLVAGRLSPALGRPVRGILRSGCYVTHDHGQYRRMMSAVAERCGCSTGLQPALEVWAQVHSQPEPGLAILGAGRRDLSYDIELPFPIARAPIGSATPRAVPASWRITALNDQHAYLRWDASDAAQAPAVGERIGLGISHPCTTFDKWAWMPVVDDDYRVVDAVTTGF